jgi:hypothetical protein
VLRSQINDLTTAGSEQPLSLFAGVAAENECGEHGLNTRLFSLWQSVLQRSGVFLLNRCDVMCFDGYTLTPQNMCCTTGDKDAAAQTLARQLDEARAAITALETELAEQAEKVAALKRELDQKTAEVRSRAVNLHPGQVQGTPAKLCSRITHVRTRRLQATHAHSCTPSTCAILDVDRLE